MRKTKTFKQNKNKRNNKYSKKTIKNRNICKKGITDEVIRIRGLYNEIKNKNKKTNKPSNDQ
jgi:hypothetical protein